jgi:hypothetical protein
MHSNGGREGAAGVEFGVVVDGGEEVLEGGSDSNMRCLGERGEGVECGLVVHGEYLC